MESKLKIAVVILNWNGKKFLEKFLPSVVKYTISNNSAIFIADNGSSDGSVNYVKENYSGIEIIQLDKNYGFSEGYNRALKQINADYYVLLNSDVEVTENWIEPIINYLDLNKDVAACMPKLLWHSHPTELEYAGAAGGFIDKYGYPFCRGRLLNVLESDRSEFSDTIRIFWASGACMFVRADLYWQAGGLDDDFFAHMEEIDLCWRLQNMGYKIMFKGDVSVYHVGGGTLPNNNPRKIYLNYRNNLLLLYKNLPSNRLAPTLITRMILDGVSAVIYLSNFSFAFFWAVFKAHIHFYRLLPKFRTKRKQIQNTNNLAKSQAIIFDGSIVYRFFIKKQRKFNEIQFKTFKNI